MKVTSARYQPGTGWLDPRNDSPQTLVLAFADPAVSESDPVWTELSETYSASVLCGCSTSGQFRGTSICDGVVEVTVVEFDHTGLAAAAATVETGSSSRRAGAQIGAQLGGAQLPGAELRGVFVLSDGLAVNGSELVAGLLTELGPEVVVTGGLAGDGNRFERTWVVDGGRVRSNRVIGIGLYGGAVSIRAGRCGGWSSFGPPREVTRAEGNVLYELDGEPALDLYRRYLGDLAAQLPASGLLMPLSIRSGGRCDSVVRTLLAIDEDARSMTFAGDVPVGSATQLMRAGIDDLIEGSAMAAELSLVGQDTGNPGLAIAVSCVGRRLVLSERADEELYAADAKLPRHIPLTGFYSYGELAPGHSGSCELHNQTMTITTITER